MGRDEPKCGRRGRPSQRRSREGTGRVTARSPRGWDFGYEWTLPESGRDGGMGAMNADGVNTRARKKAAPRPEASAPAPQPTVRLSARIEEWRADRGFGFLRFEEHRVFLHRRDFAVFHRVPAVGDVVEFVLGQDQHGRFCARHAELANDGGRIRVDDLLGLAVLLIAPVAVLARLFQYGYWYLSLGGALLPSLLAYVLYAEDKGRSRAKTWRVSEKNLHWISLLGGWPGAYLAQRRFHHKTAKAGFQFTFWLTVVLHEFVAIDFLLEWRLTHALVALLER